MGERELPRFLSTIYKVFSVKIRRAKSVSLSTQRGLHAHTKNEGFHRRSKVGYFELGRLPTHATALQEVGILPTWFISILRVVLR